MSSASQLGTLIVVFIKARNLPNRRKLGKQNPYCIARIAHDAQRTPADVRGGQTPFWNHEVRYTIMNTREHRVLKLSLLDENDSKPELIGDTTIMLEEAFAALPTEGYDNWHHLDYRGKYAGEVYIEMTFYPSRPKVPPKKKRSKRPSGMSSSMSTGSLSASMASTRPLPLQPGQQPQPLPELPISMAIPEPGYVIEDEHGYYEVSDPELHSHPHPHPHPHPHSHHPQYQQHQIPVQDVAHIAELLPRLPPGPVDDYGYDYLMETASTRPSSAQMLRPIRSQNSSPLPPNPQPQPQYHGNATYGPPDSQVRRKPVASGRPHTAQFDESIDSVPFSADSYSDRPTSSSRQSNRSRKSNRSRQKTRHSDPDILNSASYAPEPVAAPRAHSPGTVDPGVVGYTGEGQWNLSQELNNGYSHSVVNRAVRLGKPDLPPKIPLGMTPEEHQAVEYEAQDYYYRSSYR